MGKKNKQAKREAKRLRLLERLVGKEKVQEFNGFHGHVKTDASVSERINHKKHNRQQSLQDIMGLDRTREAQLQLKELTSKIRVRNDIIVIPPFLKQDLESLLPSSETKVIILTSIVSPAIVRSY